MTERIGFGANLLPYHVASVLTRLQIEPLPWPARRLAFWHVIKARTWSREQFAFISRLSILAHCDFCPSGGGGDVKRKRMGIEPTKRLFGRFTSFED